VIDVDCGLLRNPSSRFEVLQLRQTLEDMLMKSGVKDEANELSAPTQVLQQTFSVVSSFFIQNIPSDYFCAI